MPPSQDARALERLADGSGFRVRVRCGKARNRYRIPSTDEAFAEKRAAVLVELGMALAAQPPELAQRLLTEAASADGPALATIRTAVERLASGVKVKRKAENPRATWTVRELGEAWTDGTLAKDYPDHVKPLRAQNAASRLKGHVYPVIGSTRVRDLTLADIERVMASLTGKRPTQRKLSALTRRTISLTLNRLLNIAVYPLKIISASPIPKGLVPKASKRRAMAYLYPDEDAKLMAHGSIPLAERAFWGFLCREGCRVSEALAMRWSDLDLVRGAVRLDKNKTDDPRAWALSAGVAAALKSLRPENGEGLVFPPPADPQSLATDLRRRLSEAGVTRPELHTATPERMALRAHDLRGSFVTVAFANGRSESWVSDRTGHRSSQMLARYKRQARTAAELDLGDWTPLDVALGLAKRTALPGGPKRATPPRGRRGDPSRVGQRVGQNSAPDTIRTYDLGFRKALLYPTELRGR
jgi:integrase